MKYRQFSVTNLGYDSNGVHLGYEYPDLSTVAVRWRLEKGGPMDAKDMIIAYEGDTLSIGTTVLVGDMVSILINLWGWQHGTKLVDGIPTPPDEI